MRLVWCLLYKFSKDLKMDIHSKRSQKYFHVIKPHEKTFEINRSILVWKFINFLLTSYISKEFPDLSTSANRRPTPASASWKKIGRIGAPAIFNPRATARIFPAIRDESRGNTSGRGARKSPERERESGEAEEGVTCKGHDSRINNSRVISRIIIPISSYTSSGFPPRLLTAVSRFFGFTGAITAEERLVLREVWCRIRRYLFILLVTTLHCK